MEQLVVLKIGPGGFDEGFHITLQIGSAGAAPDREVVGRLPPSSGLPEAYNRWQAAYRALGSAFRLEASSESVMTGSLKQDSQLAATLLQDQLNQWLRADTFRPIRETLLQVLVPNDEIRVILQTYDHQLRRLPWHLWEWFEHYPQAELALSAPTYQRVPISPATLSVRILAILGNSTGINTTADRELLQALPHAQVTFLVEPQRQVLAEKLWAQPWDLLFFAGHSTSQEQTGCIAINQTDSLTLSQLKYALKQAVSKGLKLAIFNSCDGLGLAYELADLNIPQIIVMREPIPDQVAQAFLQYLLAALGQGHSLYLAVREARERLQGLEDQFPFASWLPIICQNPAIPSLVWPTPKSDNRLSQLPLIRSSLRRSAWVAVLVIGIRWFGLLQPLELWAYDQLLHLRPLESYDPRLLVVAITEADIQAQPDDDRRGSLSDSTLNQLLAKLEALHPRVMGLDIYRDYRVRDTVPDLAFRLANPKLMGVCKGRDIEVSSPGIPPPPEIQDSHVGFSDFIADDDGVLRRHLLFMDQDPASPCAAPYSFSTLLALEYLRQDGITLTFTGDNLLQLQDQVFYPLQPRSSGYQSIDAAGNQIMLNYRSLPQPTAIAAQVSLTDILEDRLLPAAVKDKVVLIGVSASSTSDDWITPYRSSPVATIPGVFIQAQMVSQILSHVLEGRPLIWVWPFWVEWLWMGGWSIMGSLLTSWKQQKVIGIGVLGGLSLLGLCWYSLCLGGWIPWIPALISFILASAVSLIQSQHLSQE